MVYRPKMSLLSELTYLDFASLVFHQRDGTFLNVFKYSVAYLLLNNGPISPIEPVVQLSHNNDFVVAGMDKSTRAICFIRGQEFLGWFKSSGEQITGTSSNDRMFVDVEDDSYSLVIRRLMLSDGGEYVCRGSKTSATYSLYVECKYPIRPITSLVINWLISSHDFRKVMFGNGGNDGIGRMETERE